MSLINDALRRAKQQTAQAAPGLNLPLRPMDPVHEQRRNSGILLTVVFAAALILAGAVMPMFLKDRNRPVLEASPHHASPAPTIQTPVVAAAPTVAEDLSTIAPITTEEVSLAAQAVPLVTAEAPATQPPPLKLNGIFFQTGKPSAIINGKTVYVDGRVGEFRVASISPENVLLVSATGTNILAFEE